MSKRLLALAALALLALAALPPAGADHAYSHRYIIYGRVVDANDDPVPNVTVDMRALDSFFQPENACRPQTGSNLETEAFGPTVYDPTTNEYGDFIFCFHVHQMNRVEPGTAELKINEVPDFEPVTLHFDPYFRQQFALLKLKEDRPGDAGPLATNYTVLGRLWRDVAGRDTNVEGIGVYGNTLNREPVTITLLDPSGAVVATHETRTNDYGDFAVRIPTETRFASGSVRIEAGGETFTEPASPAGVTSIKAEMPTDLSSFTGLFIVGGIVGALLIGFGGWYLWRRSGAKATAAGARRRSR